MARRTERWWVWELEDGDGICHWAGKTKAMLAALLSKPSTFAKMVPVTVTYDDGKKRRKK